MTRFHNFFSATNSRIILYILCLMLFELIRINNRKDFKKKIREFVAKKQQTLDALDCVSTIQNL